MIGRAALADAVADHRGDDVASDDRRDIDEAAGRGAMADEGMVEHDEIIELGQHVDRLLAELLQAAALPDDLDVGIGGLESRHIRRKAVEAARMIPGNAANGTKRSHDFVLSLRGGKGSVGAMTERVGNFTDARGQKR